MEIQNTTKTLQANNQVTQIEKKSNTDISTTNMTLDLAPTDSVELNTKKILYKNSYKNSSIENKEIVFKNLKANYDFVPDKLWEAFANTSGNGMDPFMFSQIFDMPKWKTGFEEKPPTLEKIDITPEKMMSYDYITIIDKNIENTKKSYQNHIERQEERIIYLNNLKDNLKKVLDYPLSPDESGIYSILIISNDYDDYVQKIYESKTYSYAIDQHKNEVSEALKRAGLSDEYLPQLAKVSNRHLFDDIIPQYRDFLMAQNSNTSEWNPQTEEQKQISENWYKNYVANYYDRLIESMGKLDDPNSKWMDPKLFDILRRSEIAKRYENGINP
ncbi:MAG: hypothetical protein OIF32_12405 [Campylobacterales bacterium]|nr:hypothetical protein [Campylobacterales bacterium]